jgi:RNA polymerase sigma factor (sigma-70 family)
MPADSLAVILNNRRDFLGFVRRRINDPATAEDILQTAYLRAIESDSHTNALRNHESAVAWFYRILRNAIIDHYRRPVSASLDEAQEPSARDAHDPEILKLACHCIETVLPSLAPSYQQLIREVDLDESSLSSFASNHGITPSNAAVRAHRARAALKQALIRTCGACSKHGCVNGNCSCTHGATTL